ncbi:glycoside hydrolase family 23 protein [Moniliophthora roreri MCA 2997]|uniref:Glycoside hydrolase family 23 protein n=1 Tax=Moniliophthora roreri (strain MCA 2997) TaxID=1381753 RepID=V2XVK3_MONRO|nr:glycoside hydrolase family 23 protein [Moniliophthora roreri MCA 2997]
MKVHSFAIAALCTAIVVDASNLHDVRHNARHSRLSRRSSTPKLARRCKNRPQGLTPSQPPAQPPAQSPPTDNNNNNNTSGNYGGDNSGQNNNNNSGQQNSGGDQQNNNNNSGQHNNGQQDNSGNSGNNNNNNGNNNGAGPIAGSVAGLLSVHSDCGDIGATKDITSITGPNGNLYWLNCGLEDSGWRPPFFTLDDIKFADLGQALNDPKSPFHACKDFTDLFYKHGTENGIPPIVLASFAMQESTCNPNTVGGGGEIGLMQLTHEKCEGASDCFNPDFNIGTGARFFKKLLDSNGGNVLQSVGAYNGWYPGMTKDAATAARHSGCCRCQQNLDYLFQTVNGWWQNIDAYSNHLGAFFNLDVC